jgi:nucleoside-diphosphate-sugar epimerase
VADRPLFALTGATGFAGRALVPLLLKKGARVRALARRSANRNIAAAAGDLEWIEGDLTTIPALEALVHGADVVVHLAGATKASDRDTFHRVNAIGAATIVDLARAASVGRFIHVSSLTAIRPHISAYAQSKAESEALAAANRGAMPLAIIRAPAILGPGDEATHALFSGLARGFLPVPGGAAANYRFSVLDVEDAAEFIWELAACPVEPVRIVAPSSHPSLGWGDVADSASRVLGKKIRQIRLSSPILAGAGRAADLAARVTGRPQVFSSDKVRELLSGDWIAETPVSRPTPLDVTLRRCLAPFLPSDR